jgi:D-glycero-D-manno-heptose 1,7-bisphosphate phosphatase
MGVGGQVASRRPAVFLDRDGVLNRAIVRGGKPYPPHSLDEFVVVPGAAADLRRLKELGFFLVVVSNQPDVARRTQTRQTVEAINAVLASALPIDDILVCFHDDADRCECRKPAPGLILEATRRHDLDPARSFLIGDRWRDVAAGQRAGVRTLFIDYQYQERRPEPPADATVASLHDAVDWIAAQTP